MKKKGVISEYLPWLLMAIALLAILMVTLFLLRGKESSLIDQIKSFLGGGGKFGGGGASGGG